MYLYSLCLLKKQLLIYIPTNSTFHYFHYNFGHTSLSLSSCKIGKLKKMSGDQHMDIPYMNMGFPYNVPEAFTGFLDGVSQPPMHYHNEPVQIQDQENAYWCLNMSYCKYGYSNLESTSYHSYETGSNHVSRPDLSERPWDYPIPMNGDEGVSSDVMYEENTIASEDAGTEDCVLSNQDDSNHQEILEDDIDPDNMTYEELLDLGETVGTQSRGLPVELINLLPTTKYKSSGIFSRKKSEERCVICQMKYKRGDRQINLPCKHIYHTECGSKWLSINKTCPICNTEVFLDE